jgi:hypothetical protein
VKPGRVADDNARPKKATAGSGEQDAIRAGQALEQGWLSATAYGLAGRVHAAEGLYAGEEAVDGPQDLRLELRRGWGHLSRPTVWLVLRLGHAPQPVRAGRPAAELLWAGTRDNEASNFFTAADRGADRPSLRY